MKRVRLDMLRLFFSKRAGGVVLRRLLIPVILTPLILHWLEQFAESEDMIVSSEGWIFHGAIVSILLLMLVVLLALQIERFDTRRIQADLERTETEKRGRMLAEEQFRVIADATRDVVWMSDPMGSNLVFINQSYEEIWGRSRKELMDDPRSYLDAVHPDDRKRVIKHLGRSKQGLEISQEYRICRPDGEVRWIWDRGFPVRDDSGRIDYYAGIARDISDLKQRELMTRELIERFELVNKATRDALWDLNLEENTLFWSDSYYEMFGRERADAPSFERWLESLHPDDKDRVREGVDKVVAGDGDTWFDEYRIRFGDGSYGYVHDRGYVLRNSKGKAARMVGTIMDIRDRKEAEEVLARHDAIFQASIDPIIGMELDGKIVDWNPGAEKLYGFAANEILGRSIALIVPEDKVSEERRVRRLIGDGSSVKRYTTTRVNKNGNRLEVEISLSPIRNAVGEIVGLMKVAHDLSRQRRIERELAALGYAVKSTSEIIFMLDPDGRLQFANQAFYDAFGFFEQEAVGAKAADLLSLRRATKHLSEIFDDPFGGPWSGEALTKRKDGAEFYVHLTITRVHDEEGVETGMIAVGRDISAQRLVMEEVARSERRFKAIFEQAAVGVCQVSTEGRFLAVNSKLCEMTGYSRKELEVMRFHDITHPDDLADDVRQVQRLLSGKSNSYSIEKRYIGKDGGDVWIGLTVSLVRKSDSSPDYFISIIEDRSARRLLEAQFLQAQKMEAVGQLAGGIAHDFNNILAFVLLRAGLVKSDASLAPAIRADLEQITSEVQRGARLTRQLLMFSRREALNPAVFNFNELVGRVVTMTDRLLGEDVFIDVSLSENGSNVYGDEGMLEQALVNLALNARDAMPGGGKLTFRTESVSIDTMTEPRALKSGAERFIRTQVADTGMGIEPENLKKIFDPFFTTKPAGEGTGLGLSSVFGVVKEHRGWIDVESTVGQGTTFELYLPLTELDREVSPDAVPEGRLRRAASGLRVLLVEDDVPLRMAVEMILLNRGYRVLAVGDGESAVDAFYSNRFEVGLVITDLRLRSGFGGRDVIQRLREDEPELPCLFVSGYSHDTNIEDILGSGHTRFLAKPFTQETLMAAIDGLLPVDNVN